MRLKCDQADLDRKMDSLAALKNIFINRIVVLFRAQRAAWRDVPTKFVMRELCAIQKAFATRIIRRVHFTNVQNVQLRNLI